MQAQLCYVPCGMAAIIDCKCCCVSHGSLVVMEVVLSCTCSTQPSHLLMPALGTRLDASATYALQLLVQSIAAVQCLCSALYAFICLLLQIWTNDKQWQGFIICCDRAAPASYPVLLQLPPNISCNLLLSSMRDIGGAAQYATSKAVCSTCSPAG